MKKLALLLGALTLVSGAAYAKEVVPVVEEVAVVEEAPVAAPTLTVKYVGQGLEIDNTSGGENIGESVMLSQHVGLAYGDNWTFDLMARKGWSMDTDDGIHSDNYRIDLDVWRHFDNYSLGFRWRQEEGMDRYYARTKYSYGMFSGWIDAAYQSNNGTSSYGSEGVGRKADGWYVEAEPVKVTVGPVTLGYYFKTETPIVQGSLNDGEEDHWYRQQLRVAFPLYQGEKLNLSFQYGWEFDNDREIEGNKPTWEHDTNTHLVWLNYSYAVTENLTLSGYYEYDMYKWEGVDGQQGDNDSNKYYGEFFLGWTYTF